MLRSRSTLVLSAALAAAALGRMSYDAVACGDPLTGRFADRAFASAATRPADYAGPLYHLANVTDAAVVGRNLLVTQDGALRAFRLRDGAELLTDVTGEAARLSADGRLALTNHDGKVKLWTITAGVYAQAKVIHEHPATTMGFSPDSTRLYLVSADRPTVAIVLDAMTLENVATLEVPREDIGSVALAPDGRHAITGSRVQGEGERAFHSFYARRTSSARLWDLRASKEIAQRPFGQNEQITRVAFSLDGFYSFLNGRPGWTTPDVVNPAPIGGEGLLSVAKRAARRGADGPGVEGEYFRVGDASVPVEIAAFSADASRVLLGAGRACYDPAGVPSLALFDAKTNKLLAHFKGHAAKVTRVAFAANNQLALAHDAAGTVTMYALPR